MEALSERVRRLEPREICVIKPSALGDIAHCLPILPALRRLFPQARISWVVNSAFQSVVAGHPDLDRVIPFDREGGISPQGVLATSRLWSRLREQEIDLAIDLQGLLRSAMMTAATRAPVRVGLADAREGAGWFYTHQVDASRTAMHAVDRVLRVASALGLESYTPSFTIPIGAQDHQWARETLASLPRPHLIVNLGARWSTKRWPPEHFAEISRRAVAEFGAGIVTIGAPEDRPLTAAFGRQLRPLPVLDLSGRTSLPQISALAQQADLFVSNDTGPLHLAAAAGATVVGIYTCTDPRLTGPYGPRATSVQSCVWCAPSFRRKCPRLECLAELSPDRVWPAVRERLGEIRESAA
jgi:lipopolysaccharide heptosyltransferase I